MSSDAPGLARRRLSVAAGCAGDASEAEEQGSAPTALRLELPYDLAVDPEGRVYVADGALLFSQTEPEPAERRVDPETGIVTTLFR